MDEQKTDSFHRAYYEREGYPLTGRMGKSLPVYGDFIKLYTQAKY